jgi:GNAT superfamily N-acetyltransferase
MPLLRIRTEIEDRPGRLAVLTAALAARGANILDLSVQVGPDGVVDEFVVDVPPDAGDLPAPWPAEASAPPPAGGGADRRGAHLAAALEAAGGTRTRVLPARPGELIDESTHALTLAARVRSNPDALPEALTELLRADGAVWTYGPVPEPEPADTLTVPAGHPQAVRLWRAGLPFTLTEAARADALVRAALPGAAPGRGFRQVTLRDGTQITVRPLEDGDGSAVRAMHERCSAKSRRLRYFHAESVPSRRGPDDLAASAQECTLVAEGPDGSILALAHLTHLLDPGVAEPAFLVEDAWQGRGLGRALTGVLSSIARERGVVELRAAVLSENARMRGLLASLGGRSRGTRQPGMEEIRLRLDGEAGRRLDGDVLHRVRAEAGRGR